jgi:hypothetical protein
MLNIFKNPYINSLIAELYIVTIVFVMHLFSRPNTPDTFFDSIAALSLFVLSAAVMGYLFIGEPLQLYLSGEKKQAVSFFMKTVLGFAILTLVALVILKSLR